MDWMLYAVIATALVFDFTNGFHDAANAIATSISTRALSLNSALIMAALLNVVGGMQGAAWAGSPISTTHVAAASIMGVGAMYRVRAVRWGLSRKIVGAWILTLPASVLAGGLAAWIFALLGLR